jgi:hypothetical protein
VVADHPGAPPSPVGRCASIPGHQGARRLLAATLLLQALQVWDENTTFYHASVSAHLRSNKIQVLHEDGVSTYTHAAKEHILHAFYVGLLSTASTAVMPQHLLGLLPAVSGLSTLEAPVLAF